MTKKDNERNNFESEEEESEPLFSDGEEENRYGRFKNADALYNSYLKLEAEFTRRSQQLKRLRNICAEHGLDGEGQPLEKDVGANGKIASAEADDDAVKESSRKANETKEEEKTDKKKSDGFSVPDDIKDEIIKEYLDGVARSRIPLLKGGGIVSAGRQKISSISRAGSLSLQYFKGEGK